MVTIIKNASKPKTEKFTTVVSNGASAENEIIHTSILTTCMTAIDIAQITHFDKLVFIIFENNKIYLHYFLMKQ